MDNNSNITEITVSFLASEADDGTKEDESLTNAKWELAIRTVLCVLSLFTNGLAIVAFAFIPRPLDCRNYLYLLINLSIVDILGSVASFLSSLNYYLIKVNVYKWIEYKLQYLMYFADVGFAIFYGVSAILVLFMAITRYITVCHPFHTRLLVEKSRIFLMIAFAWAVAILLNIPLLKYYIDGSSATSAATIISDYVISSFFILVSITTIGLCARVFVETRRLKRRMVMLYGKEYSREIIVSTDQNAVITTLLLTMTMLFSALPYWATAILYYREEDLRPVLGTVGEYFIKHLPVLNFLLDPIIYSCRTRDVKLGYGIILSSLRRNIAYTRKRLNSRNSSTISRDTQHFHLTFTDDDIASIATGGNTTVPMVKQKSEVVAEQNNVYLASPNGDLGQHEILINTDNMQGSVQIGTASKPCGERDLD
ncbi:unnamed protein product [Owenia fusiformis]|uniref:Uncharacterized protein n=1 Tax=Owenia fusiformis TaxID=6347 RepID=A0A8J1U064_OWEFU|nr:unnamed protein product [Owenia fusiformis]